MGNDGGSIPYRIDLVKTKAKEEKTDEKGLARALWLLCALSKRPLAQPVVADPLGKLYNKDAIIEYLLDRTSFGDGDQICGYVKGVKDLINLNVTPNPTYSISSPPGASGPSTNRDLDATARSPFICPLTMKEMTGALPFGLVRHCGCVFSEAGIKAVIASTSGSSSPPKQKEDKEGGNGTTVTSEKVLPCPNCSEPFDPSEGFGTGKGSAWWLPLNPKPEYQTQMLHDLTAARAAAKAAKKSNAGTNGGANTGAKKRKSEVGGRAFDLTSGDPQSGKRVKVSSTEGSGGPVRLSGKVQAELAELEAKRKAAGMSDAVKSIYAGKNGGGGKLAGSGNDFFSRTFNRYA